MQLRRTFAVLALVSALPLAASAQALPDGKTLIAKHVAAIGGRDAMDKHSSLHITGTFSLAAMGIEGPVNMYRAKPDKMLQQISIGAFGEVVNGFDGTNGWAIQPQQAPMLLSGTLLDQAKQQADFFADYPDASRYKTIETLAVEDFEGRKCYKVKLVRAVGDEESLQYFDVETGLAAGAVRSQESPMGKMTITSVMSDYKEQGGVKMPTKIVQRMPQGDISITMTTYEWDKVDMAIFALPEALKSQVKP